MKWKSDDEWLSIKGFSGHFKDEFASFKVRYFAVYHFAHFEVTFQESIYRNQYFIAVSML